MPRLENWSVVSDSSPYVAPENRSGYLRGIVFDHPTQPDGKTVHTSSIEEVRGRVVWTKHSEYHLGSPSREYEKWLEEQGFKPLDPENPIWGRKR